MDGDKCILQLRGVRPFLSNKFDITSHKRYKELSDYDRKNTFDVEGYLEHRLKLRVDEEFELIEVEGTAGDTENTGNAAEQKDKAEFFLQTGGRLWQETMQKGKGRHKGFDFYSGRMWGVPQPWGMP